jgi:hypothetical protein
VDTTDIEFRIRVAYAQLAAEAGDWVSVARVRGLLADIPRVELDEALREIERRADVYIAPETDQRRLTPTDRAAAVRIGGKDKHLLKVEPPQPRPAPRQPAATRVQVEQPPERAAVASPAAAPDLPTTGDLESLAQLRAETDLADQLLADVVASLIQVSAWCENLPDRYEDAPFFTAGLTEAITNMRGIPDDVLDTVIDSLGDLEQQLDAAERLGEAAIDVGAEGDVNGFRAP